MRTDDLIAALATNIAPRRRALAQVMLATLLAAAVGSGLVMLLGWGVRPDLHQAMASRAFWMKAAYTGAFAAAGLLLMGRLGRPGANGGRGWIALGLALATILVLAMHELMILPSALRMRDVMGDSWSRCPWRIAAIALPAFAAGFWALRRLAPTRPSLAGAAAGVMAGGVGATDYGLHCQETAAAFTAVWYTLGMLIWAAVGAVLGPRLLRW